MLCFFFKVVPDYLTIFQSISRDKDSPRLDRRPTPCPQNISLDKQSSRPPPGAGAEIRLDKESSRLGRLDPPCPGA